MLANGPSRVKQNQVVVTNSTREAEAITLRIKALNESSAVETGEFDVTQKHVDTAKEAVQNLTNILFGKSGATSFLETVSSVEAQNPFATSLVQAAERIQAEQKAKTGFTKFQLVLFEKLFNNLTSNLDEEDAKLLTHKRRAEQLYLRQLGNLNEELSFPLARIAKMKAKINETLSQLAIAEENLPLTQDKIRETNQKLYDTRKLLKERRDECQQMEDYFKNQTRRQKEQLDTLTAMKRVVDYGQGDVTELYLPAKPDNRRKNETFFSPCYPSPCADNFVCILQQKECEDPDAYCPQYRCDPAPDASNNPCGDNQCPSNTQCVPYPDVECHYDGCKQYRCQPIILTGSIPVKALKHPATCMDILKRSHNERKSGVYTLTDPIDGVTFQAYCDMVTKGGGWMLAFKQSNFGSGSAKHSTDYRGSSDLLTTRFDGTSQGSLLEYRRPKEMLFRTSVESNWFVTPSLGASYQRWDVTPSSRYCLNFNRPQLKFGKNLHISPEWDRKKQDMWLDADIELMIDNYPTISAVTVGKAVGEQMGPQCLQPHCSTIRHGRYNGKCQDNSIGEGDWLIFVR